MYPTKMEINNHIYNIDTDYKTALACFEAINDETITDIERGVAVVTLLLGKGVPLEDMQEALNKCAWYLRCGNDANPKQDEIDMDYFEDEKYIRTSIRQCYHIDINKEKNVHWWEYNELIEGLTEETLLSRIREIRTYDLREIQDAKDREKMRKAKEQVQLKRYRKDLHLTDEQEASMEALNKIIGI